MCVYVRMCVCVFVCMCMSVDSDTKAVQHVDMDINQLKSLTRGKKSGKATNKRGYWRK